ncbi:MAG: prepilin peptidase [Candidatus Aenigmatarchaeota archaeon]
MFVAITLILIFGLLTSYADIKQGKIKNSIIVAMLISSIIINAFILKITGEVAVKYIINLFASLIFSFVLWYLNFWTAGDAKLFFAYSALLPLSIYKFGIFEFFPSFTLIINSFTPIAVYIFIISLKNFNRNLFLKEFKESFSPKNILSVLMTISGVLMAIKLLFSILKYQPNFLTNTILIFLVFHLVDKKILRILSIVFLIVGFIVSPLSEILQFIKNTILIVMIFQLLMIFIKIVQLNLVKKVKVNELEPGMIIAENIVKQGNYWIKLRTKKSFSGKLIKNNSLLSDDDVKEIKNSYNSGLVKFKEVKIASTLPFAPLLFLGVIITLLAQGNMFIHLITVKDVIVGYFKYWIMQ